MFKGASAAFFATPCTTSVSMPIRCHQTDTRAARSDLGKRFVDACIDHGVQYGIFISVLGARLSM